MTPDRDPNPRVGHSEAGIARLGSLIRRVRALLPSGRRRAMRARRRQLDIVGGIVGGVGGRSGRICVWADWSTVFGLHWTSRPPPVISGPALSVRWRNMHATSTDRLLAGTAPLSAVIAGSVGMAPMVPAWQGATIIAATKPAESLHWAAIYIDGIPVAGEEMVFPDIDGLAAWVEKECQPGEVERLLASPDILKRVDLRVEGIELEERPPENPELVPALATRPLPRIARTAAAVVVVGGLGAGAWLVTERHLSGQAGAEYPVVRMTAHAVPTEVFLARCHDALRGSWPVPPGWQADAAGCVAKGMEDPHVPDPSFATGSAYRRFSLIGGHDGTLARAAAKQLLGGWEGAWRLEDSLILLERRIEVPHQRLGDTPPTQFEALRVETEAMFIGLAGDITASGGEIVLSSEASIPTVVRRLIELHRRQPLSVRRFARGRDRFEVILTPRKVVMLPEDTVPAP